MLNVLERLTQDRANAVAHLERLRAEITDLEQKIAAREQEIEKGTTFLNDVDIAVRVISRYEPVENNLIDQQLPSDNHQSEDKLKRGTKKQAIIYALRAISPASISASDLKDYVKNTSGFEIDQNTISVTLVRLKTEGAVKLDGQKWSAVTSFDDPETQSRREYSEIEAELE